VRIKQAVVKDETFVFVAGSILEVQPHRVTVLADTAIRGDDLDEAKAEAARKAAEEVQANAKTDIDLARATSELAVMAAQIAALHKYRSKK
jgi:F-type H+-transporting ATPase subunit epsilon